ncbi:MAG TPA: AAA family ATPase [Cyclobacteriaceae bacterium]|nr:AAA family ATPase [Cyclobacteriaceae bacterium]
MIRGLVIGKFLPVHKGHLGLISFAARQCDELIVSMAEASNDPIDANLRLSWLKQLTAQWENVKICSLKDDFDQEDLPWAVRTKTWASVINKAYGHIDKVFSSEDYGEYFARNLGAFSVLFDRQRKMFPVSASSIRKSPFDYWEFIPEVVRPYFVKKICFYGPESTGKSSTAIRMAKRYNTLSVPEVAREMITTNDFTIEDIIRIGHAQTDRVLELAPQANKILFCDTDLITTQIYSKYYLGVVPGILYELEKQVTYDKYFFFDIDVPWIADGLRDLGDKREEMKEIFLKELAVRNIDFVLVSGSPETRDEVIQKEIEKLILPSPTSFPQSPT